MAFHFGHRVMEQEGVIKFSLQQNYTSIEEPSEFACLEKNRQRLFHAGLLGQNSSKYEGYAFGNVSMRINKKQFIISGSQTSGKPKLSIKDYAIVQDWNIKQNKLSATGVTNASSESLSHAMLYQINDTIQYVFHVHNKGIWQQSDIPAIAEHIAYGTIDMAIAIENLIHSLNMNNRGIFRMKGHEDGIISFATNAEDCINLLFKHIAETG